MTKVQLIKRHTHAGTEYEPDAVIEVSEADAQWLSEHGVVQQGNKRSRWLKSVPDTRNDDEDLT